MIQLVAGDTVSSATPASRAWLAAHARIVGGKTVLELGGTQHTLSSPVLRQVVASAVAG